MPVDDEELLEALVPEELELLDEWAPEETEETEETEEPEEPWLPDEPPVALDELVPEELGELVVEVPPPPWRQTSSTQAYPGKSASQSEAVAQVQTAGCFALKAVGGRLRSSSTMSAMSVALRPASAKRGIGGQRTAPWLSTPFRIALLT